MMAYIRSRVPYYLNATSGTGPNAIVVWQHHPNPNVSDEIWWIEAVSGSEALMSGDAVYIRTRAHYYLNAASGMGPNVIAVNRHHPDPAVSDEIWWIEKVQGSGSIMHGDAVYIRTRAHYYLNAASGTGPNVIAVNRHHPDPAVSDEIWWIDEVLPIDLGFNMERQAQTQWCWAAVARSISRFFDGQSNWTQCALGVCAAERTAGVGVGRMGHADELQAVRAGAELSAAAVASGLAF